MELARSLLILIALLAVAVSQSARADQPAAAEKPLKEEAEKAEESEEAKARLKFMLDALGEYSVEVQGLKGPETPKLLTNPALRWTNTVSGTKDGIVCVWTSGGRPEVVVQFSSPGAWVHEFCSTSTRSFSMTRNGQKVWFPKTAGVILAPIPKAPATADTPVKRLFQMRAIAERFEIIDDFHPVYQDLQTIERTTLRLLPKPIYRYEPTGDLIDGALFALVITTDPEALLMVEAHRTDKGAEYRYALARMTVYALTAKLDGAEVWKVPEKRAGEWQRDEPYFVGVHR